MNTQELIDFLNQNDEIGRNKPTSDVKIAVGVLKLKQEGFPEPGKDFYKLLRHFNGLSNNGCVVLGINTENRLFPDLLSYNIASQQPNERKEVILGYNDAFWLVYNPEDKKYRIIDPDDGAEEGSSDNLAEVIPYILHI